jgi:hypothetical protein
MRAFLVSTVVTRYGLYVLETIRIDDPRFADREVKSALPSPVEIRDEESAHGSGSG